MDKNPAENMLKLSFLQKLSGLAVLLFGALLPFKFASLAVSTNGASGFYPEEWWLWLFTDWPMSGLGICTGSILLLTLLAGKKQSKNGFWGILGVALLAMVGFTTRGHLLEYTQSLFIYLGAVAAYVAAVINCNDFYPDFRRKFLMAWSVGTGLVLISGVYQYFWGFDEMAEAFKAMNLPPSQLEVKIAEKRIFASFTLCNALAGFLVLSLPLLVYQGYKIGLAKGVKFAWSSAIFLVLVGAFVLWGTGNRAAVLALATGAVAYMLGAKWPLWTKIWLGMAALLAVGAIFTAAYWSGRDFSSWSSRLDYAQSTIKMFKINPVCGTGWGSFKKLHGTMKGIKNAEFAEDPHNVLLAFMGAGGAVSLWVFGVLLTGAYVVMLRRIRKNGTNNIEGAVLIGTVAGGLHLMVDMGWLFAPILGGIFIWCLLEDPEKTSRNSYWRLFLASLYAVVLIAGSASLSRIDYRNYILDTPVELRVK